jgi:hypothetical protein
VKGQAVRSTLVDHPHQGAMTMSARRAFRPVATDRLEPRDVPSAISISFSPPTATTAVNRFAVDASSFNPTRSGLPLVLARMSGMGSTGSINPFRPTGFNMEPATGLGTTTFGGLPTTLEAGATTPTTGTTTTFNATVMPTSATNTPLSSQGTLHPTNSLPFANRGLFDITIGGVKVTLNGV